MGPSGGEAKAAALHTDLQAVCRLAAGIDDAAVHVAGQVTVATLLRRTAAAETRVIPCTGAAGGTVQHNVTQSQELAEEAGQNTVNTAVCRETETEFIHFHHLIHFLTVCVIMLVFFPLSLI